MFFALHATGVICSALPGTPHGMCMQYLHSTLHRFMLRASSLKRTHTTGPLCPNQQRFWWPLAAHPHTHIHDVHVYPPLASCILVAPKSEVDSLHEYPIPSYAIVIHVQNIHSTDPSRMTYTLQDIIFFNANANLLLSTYTPLTLTVLMKVWMD